MLIDSAIQRSGSIDREARPAAARQQACPGAAIDDNRRGPRRDDRDKSPADLREYPEQRRRIGGEHQPNEDREAERQSEVAEDAGHGLGCDTIFRRRHLTELAAAGP